MQAYARPMRWIHWITALLFITAALIGFYCGLQPAGTSPRRELLEVHKSLGVTVLVISILRLLVRAIVKAPPQPHTSSLFIRLASGLNHLGLYVLLLAMPVTGYLFSSAGNYRLRYFGTFELPRVFAGQEGVAHFGEVSHDLLAWVVYVAVAMHVLATIWHVVVLKDGTLDRMWPRRSGSGSAQGGS
ncbi:cytochrome b [Bradyrhizobium diazoefficiens]|jgi:cytochrome b561|nr:cytochrome b [Bradyrhizobium diazoefficiens]UCF54647.1 MAG: cytochrome b [Bradyrhizobium sp.]MBR0964552.1 cytochrome b [Bradyrhizobium diazoefficiens]MBR0978712.1 cytochrome b [Bradyrhizobium diazoefficiens]MBR1008263.1 cytochrome b [Bradyrhizobium diazoefficiens]MBR1013805.1 cytochrome b [Bradyrhizobium diazoefficiens]